MPVLSSNSGNESRTHNSQNQITSGVVTHDDNGNMTNTTSSSEDYVYDAWNRMVEFSISASVYEYPFDALGRRTQEEVNEFQGDEENPPSVYYRDLYYSDRWQVLGTYFFRTGYNERTTETETFVWTPGYVDELVLSDSRTLVEEDDDSDPYVNGEWSTLDDYCARNYVHQDANFNVTSIGGTATSPESRVTTRFVYDPYGSSTVLNASWASGSSLFMYRHQGGRLNLRAALYHFRNRDYSAELGRWMQQDPIGYVDGASLYQSVLSSPVSWVDPSGLTSRPRDKGTVEYGPTGERYVDWRLSLPGDHNGDGHVDVRDQAGGYDPKTNTAYTPPAWEDDAQFILTTIAIVSPSTGLALVTSPTRVKILLTGAWDIGVVIYQHYATE